MNSYPTTGTQTRKPFVLHKLSTRTLWLFAITVGAMTSAALFTIPLLWIHFRPLFFCATAFIFACFLALFTLRSYLHDRERGTGKPISLENIV
jgi:hypothetical protein